MWILHWFYGLWLILRTIATYKDFDIERDIASVINKHPRIFKMVKNISGAAVYMAAFTIAQEESRRHMEKKGGCLE